MGIQQLDIEYISRLTTFIVTLYSVIKIYALSHYDDGAQDGHSNIFVSIATMAGVVLFGHTVRRLGLCVFGAIVNVLSPPHHRYDYLLMTLTGMCTPFIVAVILKSGVFAESSCEEGADLWAAIVFDNVLAKEYEYLFPEGAHMYLEWIRAGFTQLGFVVLASCFGMLIKMVLVSSYKRVREWSEHDLV